MGETQKLLFFKEKNGMNLLLKIKFKSFFSEFLERQNEKEKDTNIKLIINGDRRKKEV